MVGTIDAEWERGYACDDQLAHCQSGTSQRRTPNAPLSSHPSFWFGRLQALIERGVNWDDDEFAFAATCLAECAKTAGQIAPSTILCFDAYPPICWQICLNNPTRASRANLRKAHEMLHLLIPDYLRDHTPIRASLSRTEF